MTRPDADTLFSFSIDQNAISPEVCRQKVESKISEGIDVFPWGPSRDKNIRKEH